MKKRITLWLLAIFFLANVSLADAQQTGKVPRIGFLDPSTASGTAEEDSGTSTLYRAHLKLMQLAK